MTYTGRAERVGDFWKITVNDVGVTQAERLEDVFRMAVDLVAVTQDVPLETVEVYIEVRG